MRRRWSVSLAASLLLAMLAGTAPAAQGDARNQAREHVKFGISVARRGLWGEALYRWKLAVEIDPTYAAAYNDLAVAYEQEGELELARQAYEKAMELEPDNIMIRQNFELFQEVNERAQDR